MALRHEKRLVKKSEIALGREGTSEAAKFPEVRNEIVALKKLEQEQREFALRIAQIEDALKQIEQQRQENSRAQNAEIARLEEKKRPLVQQRDEAKAAADHCAKDLETADRQLAEKEATEQELLKKLSLLQATEPPPADLQEQMARIADQRASLPNEKAEITQARLTKVEACREAREKLTAAETAVTQVDKKIARVRAEFEARDRTLNESSRAQQEEVRKARQQHQTVEEKKDPAYLNIGRHLADAGIAPPNAPHLLADVQRHRAAVKQHEEHTQALAQLSGQIDRQELRQFYFSIASLLVLLAIALSLASQSPVKREWLPQDTVTILSLNPPQLSSNSFTQAWQKEQPESWRNVFAGLAGAAVHTPVLNISRDAGRITRAMTLSDNNEPEHDYVLVEARGEIGPVLRGISQDKSFSQSTVSGLVVWERPDVAVARVGPKTLAVGSTSEVDRLVEVRLGTEPDLKVEDPLLKELQSLDPDRTFRLVSRSPDDLGRFFGPIFPPELLSSSRLVGLAVTLGKPNKAHLFVRAKDSKTAQHLVADIAKDASRWLSLPGSDFILAAAAPKAERNDADVDLNFDIPDGAAHLLLQRLARIQPAPAQ